MILHFTELYPLNKGKKARARKSDPNTSHKAAERTESLAETHLQRQSIKHAIYTLNGATAKEISRWTGIDYIAVGKRLSEIEGIYRTDDELEGCKVWRIHNA